MSFKSTTNSNFAQQFRAWFPPWIESSVTACGVLLAGWVWLVLWRFPPPPSGARSGGELGTELSWWAPAVLPLLWGRERALSSCFSSCKVHLASSAGNSKGGRCGFPHEGGNKARVGLRAWDLFSRTLFGPEWVFDLVYCTMGCSTLESKWALVFCLTWVLLVGL